jgi:hypothetical protein
MNKICLNQTAATVKLSTSPYSCLETKDYSHSSPKGWLKAQAKFQTKGENVAFRKNEIDRALPYFDF